MDKQLTLPLGPARPIRHLDFPFAPVGTVQDFAFTPKEPCDVKPRLKRERRTLGDYAARRLGWR